jgi:AbrB family looped-hinge helix DNA binding protein
MKNSTYTLKVSSQSQVTLPRSLRERLRLQPGSRITIKVAKDDSLQLSDKLPIEEHFGRLSNAWTSKGQDASEYSRELRNSMQPKLKV